MSQITAPNIYEGWKVGVEALIKKLQISLESLTAKRVGFLHNGRMVDLDKDYIFSPNSYPKAKGQFTQEYLSYILNVFDLERKIRLLTSKNHYPNEHKDIKLKYLSTYLHFDITPNHSDEFAIMKNSDGRDIGFLKQGSYKTQQELYDEYKLLLQEIDRLENNQILLKESSDNLREELYLAYAHMIKCAPLTPTKTEEQVVEDSNTDDPNYDQFSFEVEKVSEKIKEETAQKAELEKAYNEILEQIISLSKRQDLSYDERNYQKLTLEIKAKELEVKLINMTGSIRNLEIYRYHKELGLERMKRKIDIITYSYQVNNSRFQNQIIKCEVEMEASTAENELYAMQERMLCIEYARGTISNEDRMIQLLELKEKKQRNDEDCIDAAKELFAMRRGRIQKQIEARQSMGLISPETAVAQSNALFNSPIINDSHEVYISNIFVNKDGKVHNSQEESFKK